MGLIAEWAGDPGIAHCRGAKGAGEGSDDGEGGREEEGGHIQASGVADRPARTGLRWT